jgi:hypothetical protein
MSERQARQAVPRITRRRANPRLPQSTCSYLPALPSLDWVACRHIRKTPALAYYVVPVHTFPIPSDRNRKDSIPRRNHGGFRPDIHDLHGHQFRAGRQHRSCYQHVQQYHDDAK